MEESYCTLFESPIFNQKYYDLLCDNARSPHLWAWDEKSGWKLRKKIFDEVLNEEEQSASKWEGNSLKIR